LCFDADLRVITSKNMSNPGLKLSQSTNKHA
jgi:hypothetical protein